MGTFQSKYEEIGSEGNQKIKRLIKEKGVVQQLMREKCYIKIGVAGVTGVGKSSFINAIRGISDEDENAAKTDVVELITPESPFYDFPDHQNISIVDLPAVGTQSCPNLEIFCEKVCLQTYDIFFILTDKRLKRLEIELAQKIKSMGKRFFLIRTKIDQDELGEKRKKNCDIDAMLRRIRDYLNEGAEDLEIRENEIFLISNHHPDRWDFKRLKAITEGLPTSLWLTLSQDILLEKVKVLQGGINCWFWFQSILVWLFPCCSEYESFVEKVKFYNSELGFPVKKSEDFNKMNQELQDKVGKFTLTSQEEIASWIRELKAECGDEDSASGNEKRNETSRLPLLFAYKSLPIVLGEMKEAALEILQFSAEKSSPDKDMRQI